MQPRQISLEPEARPRRSLKRDAILTAARDVFASRGYGASCEDIAAAAGVSKQTIYNQFGSKEQLFHAIVEQRAQQITAPLAPASHQRPVRDMLLEVALAIQDIQTVNVRSNLMRAVISASTAFPAVAQDFYETGPMQMLRALAEWMRVENSAGRLRVSDPQMAAEHFFGLLSGHQLVKSLLGLARGFTAKERARRCAYCVDLFLAAHGPDARH